ncbi:thiamine phosphate synthase [Pelagibacteraceae bacterium]|nr:thiamine phosphate synthase [Pelagibacteraceae bacterium]MDC0937480.1 thiamine phosphate synthase [Pelagibacteraceae bacterium]
MFAFKKNYYLIIESIKDINLSIIKKRHKFIIIYRNKKNNEKYDELLMFRNMCKRKHIFFYVANDLFLARNLKADGLYISAFNRKIRKPFSNNFKFKVIGSAHNVKEINIKKLQGCSKIIFSRLFKTSYEYKKSFLGIIKYNLIANLFGNQLVPLGGIKISNLNKLKTVDCEAFTVFSEVKKKPAIIDRLF